MSVPNSKKGRGSTLEVMKRDTEVAYDSPPSFMLPLVGFKSRKAAQMAAFFAVKSAMPNHGMIEKLKLIKLIYFSEREHLKQYRLPMLFDESDPTSRSDLLGNAHMDPR